MAQITIVAENATDLRDTMRDLLGMDRVTGPAPAAEVSQGSDEPEPEPAKRTRRTKEQIAADAAKADPTPALQSGTPAQTDAGGPSDLEKELLGEGTAQVDYATLAAAGTAHIAKHGADKTMAVLEQHGAGAKSFKQVPTESYGAVYAALQAELP